MAVPIMTLLVNICVTSDPFYTSCFVSLRVLADSVPMHALKSAMLHIGQRKTSL